MRSSTLYRAYIFPRFPIFYRYGVSQQWRLPNATASRVEAVIAGVLFHEFALALPARDAIVARLSVTLPKLIVRAQIASEMEIHV